MQTTSTNNSDLVQAKKRIRLLTAILLFLVPVTLIFGYLWLNAPKNLFASFSKEKKEEYLKAILLGGDISVEMATNQLAKFIAKRDSNMLNSGNMPLAVCFTSREIIAFLNTAYSYNLDLTTIPEDNKGVAFIYGMSGKADYRKDKGTIMIVSTDFAEYAKPTDGSPDPNVGRVTVDNKVVKLGSSVKTSAYDIGSIYP